MEEIKNELETATPSSTEALNNTTTENSNEVAVKKEEPEVLQPEPSVEKQPEPIVKEEPAMEQKVETQTSVATEDVNNSIQQNNDTMSYEFVEKKHKNKKLIILILVIMLIALVIFGIKLYLGDSKVLLKGALNRGYTSISELLDEIEKNELDYNSDESIVMNGNLKLKTNLEELAQYTDYTYDFNLGMDLKAEQMEVGLSMNKDNQTIINGLAHVIKNIAYLKSDKIYPQMLYMDMGSNMFEEMKEETPQTINYDDIDKLANKFTIYLNNAFNRDAFTKEEATIKINGNDVVVTKHNYEFNEQNSYDFMSSILTSIKEDEEFIELLAKVTSVEIDEIKELLNEANIEKEDFEGMEKFNFCLYTEGFFSKVVGLGLYDSETNMLATKDGEREELVIKSSYFDMSLVTENDVTTGSIKSDGEEVMSFKLTVQKSGQTTTEVVEFDVKDTFNGKVELKTDRISDKKMEMTISANIEMPAEEGITTLGADFNYGIAIGSKLSEINTEGAVDFNTLTEEDLQQISTNFTNAVAGTPLELLLTSEDTEEPAVDYRINDLLNIFPTEEKN